MSDKITIPVIDCSEIRDLSLDGIENKPAFKTFTKQFGDGIRDMGFVYLTNYNLHLKPGESLLQKSLEFFELPIETKSKYRKLGALENFHGYESIDDENIGEVIDGVRPPNSKEAFDFWGTKANDELNYPPEVNGFKTAVEEFRNSLSSLGQKMLLSLAIYLKLSDKDYFLKQHLNLDKNVAESTSSVRTNYYFPMSQDGNKEVFRLGEHCDLGTITLLIQDSIGGLETKQKNGEWLPVTPIENSIVVNTGIRFEIWTGGHILANPHRVRFIQGAPTTKARQSVAFFIHADNNTYCKPQLPSLSGWTSYYKHSENETQIEFFRNSILSSRMQYNNTSAGATTNGDSNSDSTVKKRKISSSEAEVSNERTNGISATSKKRKQEEAL